MENDGMKNILDWYAREKARVESERRDRHARAEAVKAWDHFAGEAAAIWRRFTSDGAVPAYSMIDRPRLVNMYWTYAWLQAVGLAQKCMVWSEVLEMEERGRTEAVNSNMDDETGILLGGAFALERCCMNAAAKGLDLSAIIEDVRSSATDDQKVDAYRRK